MAADASPNFLNCRDAIHRQGLLDRLNTHRPSRAYHVIIASVYFGPRVMDHVPLLCQTLTAVVRSVFVVLIYCTHSCLLLMVLYE